MTTTSQPSAFHTLLGFPVVLSSFLAVTVFFFVPRSMADPDIWWHLRNAQLFVQSHHFMVRDTYSFTAAGAPWINHEWLAELPFYAAWQFGGARGVFWVTLLVTEAVMLGVFTLSYRRSKSLMGALLASLVAAFLASVSFGPRTLLFGWLFLVVELLIMEASERRSRYIWFLPLLFTFWVNTHGSWMIGLVLLAVYVVTGMRALHWGVLSSRGFSKAMLKDLVGSGCLSVGCLFINPYGWRLVAYPLSLAFHQRLNVANVEEWARLDFHSPRGIALLLCLASLAVWQLIRQPSWKITEAAYWVIAIYSALNYSRFLFLFAILSAPVLADRFREFFMTSKPSPKPALNLALIAFMLAFVVAATRHPQDRVDETKRYPTEALAFLSKFHSDGRVFNEYLWGGYMIWHLHQWPTFIDSRVDIFEYNGTFADYLGIIRIKDTDRLLRKNKIRYVFFEKNTPLVYLLLHTGEWIVDYDRDNVVLLERRV